ncbi:MAG TPA: peptidoglycan-binding domain-containing protein [Ramlibacter sp.]|jgi:hypothetical protein|nr:peptidoglycan-binding domain-containing protein [Ramlibacter sp.]
MALEPVFARGCQGDIVRALQAVLLKTMVPKEGGTGTEPALVGKADGAFGAGMQRAIERVQAARGKVVTGVVEADTWKLIMGAQPWPDEFSRFVGVCSGAEGHGYTVATGNEDGAGMTWGLIGFALVSSNAVGKLPKLLRSIYRQHKALFDEAFGAERSAQLVNALKLDHATEPQLDREKLLQFAIPLSAPGGKRLLDPWQEAFAKLGGAAKVQAIQRELAENDFYKPAMVAAGKYDEFGMACERTRLFFLDVHINNGSVKSEEDALAREGIKKLMLEQPQAPVAAKLLKIRNALIELRAPKYELLIRRRKSTIAYGVGLVSKGMFLRLDGWGIDVSEPGASAQPLPLSHVGVTLDQQVGESIARAAAAAKLGLAPEPAAYFLDPQRTQEGSPECFPADTGIRLATSSGGSAVVLPGLATVGAAAINPKKQEVYDGLQLLFRGRPAVLAISGQYVHSARASGKGDVVVLQRANKTWAGLALKANDQLLVIRQRERRHDAQESSLNISDVRRHLGSCQLLLLYLSLGVPNEKQPGSGPRWRQWLRPTGANPIVLGWFGAISPPRDDTQKSLADQVFAQLQALEPAADFATLCAKYEQQLIQLWGAACHNAFAKGPQPYLWHAQMHPGPGVALSGAAAIDRAGQAWVANPDFGQSGEPAMKKGT